MEATGKIIYKQHIYRIHRNQSQNYTFGWTVAQIVFWLWLKSSWFKSFQIKNGKIFFGNNSVDGFSGLRGENEPSILLTYSQKQIRVARDHRINAPCHEIFGWYINIELWKWNYVKASFVKVIMSNFALLMISVHSKLSVSPKQKRENGRKCMEKNRKSQNIYDIERYPEMEKLQH